MPAQFWTSLLNSPNSTVDGAALANSTTSTVIDPTPPLVFPANYCYPGLVLEVEAWGKYSTTGSPTMIWTLAWGGFGGVTLAATAALTLGATQTNLPWHFTASVQCRAVGSGTSGSLFAMGEVIVELTTTTIAAALLPSSAPAAVGVDTTTAKALNLLATWGTSSASNTLTCHHYLVTARN